MRSVLLWAAALSIQMVHAQSDIIGTAGQYGMQTGARGAVANRRIADQLYKQSLQDESNAWKGGIPNVGLLSKSLSESKDAKMADDQAKEFARGALAASQTGGNSGDYQANRYGGVSDAQLTDLATKSSPYMAAVQGKLGGYGMSLASDKMSLKTPVGNFDMNMSTQMLEKTLVGVANSFGFGGSSVSQGIADAVKTREQIAASVVAAVDAELAKGDSAARAPAAKVDAMPAAAVAKPEPADGTGHVVAGDMPASTLGSGDGIDWDAKQKALQANQEAVRRRLGLKTPEELGPIGHPEEDLFQKVHLKYMSLAADGAFIGPMASQKPLAALTPPKVK